MKQIDYSPLVSAVTIDDIKNHFKRSGRLTYIGLIVFFLIFAMVGLFGPVPMIIRSFQTGSNDSLAGGVVFLVVLGLIFGAIAWMIVHSTRQTIRLQRFAAVNGFTFVNNVRNPDYAGMIFSHGDSRMLLVSLASRGAHGKGIEMGNYQYMVGSGKNRHSVDYGFVKIELTRALPHLVLDAKSNNLFGRFSNLPSSYDTSQRLNLEGDFNNYFNLYAPKAYERDALYVMTPDVMATLIDGAKAYDLEIVDNELFIYSSTPFGLHKQAELEKLFAMANTIAKELDEQTDFYADERVGNRAVNIVADPGRRLKKGVNWIVILVIAYVVINVILQIAGVGSHLF